MAWQDPVTTDFLTVDASFEFLVSNNDPLVISLNPRETAQLLFTVDAAGITDDLEIEILQGHLFTSGSTFDVGGTTTGQINTINDSFVNDDDMNGMYLLFVTSGAARGEGRLITDSTAATDLVTFSHAATAFSTDPYAIYRFSPFRIRMDPQTTIDSDNQNNTGITVHGANGRYVAVVARATGATDAHRVRMSYQLDGVSA